MLNVNIIFIFLVGLIISCTPRATFFSGPTGEKMNKIKIDTLVTFNKNIKIIKYSVSESDSLIKYREQFDIIFADDECFECFDSTWIINLSNDSTFKLMSGGRKVFFDYQFWNNGLPKIDNVIKQEAEGLFLYRNSYDSINNLLSTKKYLFVRDSSIEIYHYEIISAWFEVLD